MTWLVECLSEGRWCESQSSVLQFHIAFTDDARTSATSKARQGAAARIFGYGGWEKLFAATGDQVPTTESQFAAGDRVVVRWRYDFSGGHVRGGDLFRVRAGWWRRRCRTSTADHDPPPSR